MPDPIVFDVSQKNLTHEFYSHSSGPLLSDILIQHELAHGTFNVSGLSMCMQSVGPLITDPSISSKTLQTIQLQSDMRVVGEPTYLTNFRAAIEVADTINTANSRGYNNRSWGYRLRNSFLAR